MVKQLPSMYISPGFHASLQGENKEEEEEAEGERERGGGDEEEKREEGERVARRKPQF